MAILIGRLFQHSGLEQKKNAGNSNVNLQSWPAAAVPRGEAGSELPWMVEQQTVADWSCK